MTGIQTPIGGWHRAPHFKQEPEWPTRPDVLEDAATLPIGGDTLVMEAFPEAIRYMPPPKKNEKPVFRSYNEGSCRFRVYPPGTATGTTDVPRWSEYTPWYSIGWLLTCTIVLAPVAFLMWLLADLKISKEVLRQIGYKETGPYTVYWGIYEWKNGKAYRLGLNRPGDDL